MNLETERGKLMVTSITSTFTFAGVPNGRYLLRAEPPPDSGLTPSVPRPVEVLAGVLPAPVVNDLALTTALYTGTVLSPGPQGAPVTASVQVRLNNQFFMRAPAPGGHFLLGGMPPGTYTFIANRTTDDPLFDSMPLSVTVGIADPAKPLTLTLTPAQIWGHVVELPGNNQPPAPVPFVGVLASVPGLTLINPTSYPSGYWAIGGLPPGAAVTVRAFPPPYKPNLQPSSPLNVNLGGAVSNPYDLILPASSKIVTGVVQTDAGVPVRAAQVFATRLDAPSSYPPASTDVNGVYNLALGPGQWSLTVRNTPVAVPNNWVYAQPPQLAGFAPTQDPQNLVVNFTVRTADGGVTGAVQLPFGGTPPFSVTVGIVNDEGVGRQVPVRPDGTFNIPVPSGVYRVVVAPNDPGYLGPVVAPVNVPPSTTVPVVPFTLTLLARNSAITGTVLGTGGEPVGGVPISAWRPGVPGAVTSLTGPDGAYVLAVAGGVWQVQPHPAPDQPYIFRGEPLSATVPVSAVVPGLNFNLLRADALVQGAVVDPRGQVVGAAAGYVQARNVISPVLSVGVPLQQGKFTLRLVPGDYRVGARLPAGVDFLSSAELSVTAVSGLTQTITLTVRDVQTNTLIAGKLVDIRANTVVRGVTGDVTAWSGDDSAATPLGPSGMYTLPVAPGLWRLDYRVDPTFVAKVVGARTVPVVASQVTYVDLPVLYKDGFLTGTVLSANGAPLAGVRVAARGLFPPLRDQWFTAITNAAGRFELRLPGGRYNVGAGSRDDAIWPVEREVLVPRAGSANVTLQFRAADATLSGTLTLSNSTTAGPAQIWAWSEDGGLAKGTATLTNGAGGYSLSVVTGRIWHIRALFGTDTQVWFGSGDVSVTGSAATLDLTLAGPRTRPGPMVVTFDAADPQSLTLSDGTDIYIPAGALPATGQVTLRIEPIVTLTGHRGAEVFRYGYAFLASDSNGQPITSNFNQDVVIRFGYDEAELTRLGIREDRLRPAYFSTTTNTWSYPDSYVVDTSANEVTMQVDHFTDFALTGQTAAYDILLPAIQK